MDNTSKTVVTIVDRGVEMNDYPFQLRLGIWAHFKLPVDLTLHDVGRLTRFPEALAIDDA
jgi:hypothetical protein